MPMDLYVGLYVNLDMPNTEMFYKVQNRVVDLMEDKRENIDKKILLMHSGLIKVTAKKTYDGTLKVRVQSCTNPRKHRTFECTQWDVMGFIKIAEKELFEV